MLWRRLQQYIRLEECRQRKRYGFASFLLVKTEAPVYNVNTKASEAVMNSGLSVTGMHKFTASLEIPPDRARTLK